MIKLALAIGFLKSLDDDLKDAEEMENISITDILEMSVAD